MGDIDEPAGGAPVNLLALDGGGIRGVSELLILHEIMVRIQADQKLDKLPRPCEYFHLIGGTSTGGLIALMIGRLRMTTEEALEQYNLLAGRVFSSKNRKRLLQDGMFRATTLEDEIKKVVEKHVDGADCNEKMFDSANECEMGKTFVCAMPAANMRHSRRFRTYKVSRNATANCTIWEACRATSSAPTFFKRISIGEDGQIKEDFIDGGIKCNNPAREVIDEAWDVFGRRPFGCLVSIGTGSPGTIGLSKPGGFQKVLPTKLIKVLKEIATDCETTSDDLTRQFKQNLDLYFRFNVTFGAGVISMEEWEKMGDVKTHTVAYLQDPRVSRSVDTLVELLCRPKTPEECQDRQLVGLADIYQSFTTNSHPENPHPEAPDRGPNAGKHGVPGFPGLRSRLRPRREGNQSPQPENRVSAQVDAASDLEQKFKHGEKELAQRIRALEELEKHHKDRMEELEAAKSSLELQEERSAQRIQALEESEKRLLDENRILETQVKDLNTQIEATTNIPRMVGIGGACYADLRNIDEARLPELDAKLHEFRDWVVLLSNEDSLGNEARARVIKILNAFGVKYTDHEAQTRSRLCGSVFGRLIHRAVGMGEKMDIWAANRAHWSNQHQDCLLVVEALETARGLMVWRGIWD